MTTWPMASQIARMAGLFSVLLEFMRHVSLNMVCLVLDWALWKQTLRQTVVCFLQGSEDVRSGGGFALHLQLISS